MLAHPTLDLLHALGLHGLAKGYQEIAANPEARALDHAEWLGLLLEHEATLRRQKRFETRARAARLRHAASIEDVDYENDPLEERRTCRRDPVMERTPRRGFPGRPTRRSPSG